MKDILSELRNNTPSTVSKFQVRRKAPWADFEREFKKKWFDGKKNFSVTFTGEEGIDGGGPKREFFSGLIILYI